MSMSLPLGLCSAVAVIACVKYANLQVMCTVFAAAMLAARVGWFYTSDDTAVESDTGSDSVSVTGSDLVSGSDSDSDSDSEDESEGSCGHSIGGAQNGGEDTQSSPSTYTEK